MVLAKLPTMVLAENAYHGISKLKIAYRNTIEKNRPTNLEYNDKNNLTKEAYYRNRLARVC